MDRTSIVGTCVLEARVVHVPDATSAAEQFPRMRESPLWKLGFESRLCVPLLLDKRVVGVINVFRCTVGAFSSRDVELVQSFADQAVIAIENSRWFRELTEREIELSAALERQEYSG